MDYVVMISLVALWFAALLLGFLLWGVLRNLGHLHWRLDHLEATRPTRLGRSGLAPGARAPSFVLPDLNGEEVPLTRFRGRDLLLVFVQSGCGPCLEIVPELNRLHRKGRLHVLAINNASLDEARDWAKFTEAAFPVLAQQKWEVSKKYQILATPFAYRIDEQGQILAAGIVNSRQHLEFLIQAADDHRRQPRDDAATDANGDDDLNLTNSALSPPKPAAVE